MVFETSHLQLKVGHLLVEHVESPVNAGKWVQAAVVELLRCEFERLVDRLDGRLELQPLPGKLRIIVGGDLHGL